MYENVSNEELLNMLINSNEVGASQEAIEKLYDEVLRRMNASQQSFAPDAEAVCVCSDELFAVNPDCKCAWCKLPRR